MISNVCLVFRLFSGARCPGESALPVPSGTKLQYRKHSCASLLAETVAAATTELLLHFAASWSGSGLCGSVLVLLLTLLQSHISFSVLFAAVYSGQRYSLGCLGTRAGLM